MKKQISLGVNDRVSFFSATKNYFLKAGFKKIRETETELHFSRGSVLLNMITFNPLNWKSTVAVTVRDATVAAEFDINTFGQLVTPKEEALWDTFVENYKVSITRGVDLSGENQTKVRETKSDSLKYIRSALMGAFIFGVPFGVLGYVTGLNILTPTGAAIGAVYFMASRINKERKKT